MQQDLRGVLRTGAVVVAAVHASVVRGASVARARKQRNSGPEALRERFRSAYAAARTLNERANSANDSYRNALADKHLAQRAGVLIAAGVKLPPADWHIPESTMAGVERAMKNVGIRIDKQMPVLEESDRHFQAALTAGLSLIARASASDPADVRRDT